MINLSINICNVICSKVGWLVKTLASAVESLLIVSGCLSNFHFISNNMTK